MKAKVKFDPADKDILISGERRKSLDIHRLLSLIPVMPYHVIADIGCGPGYFTIPLAKYLFDGKVFALDVQQEMLDATKGEVKAVNLTNVKMVLSEEETLPLKDASIDGGLAAFVLQEAENPTALLMESHRALKKSGWLAILEWHKRKTRDGPPVKQRIEEKKLRGMAEKLGFKFRSRHDLNGSQYMLIMRK